MRHLTLHELAQNLDPEQNAELYRLLQKIKANSRGSAEAVVDCALGEIEEVERLNIGPEDWAKLLG